jgi:nitroreductase
MEFESVLRRRKMCRSFDGSPVPPHLLERILASGRRAPSAGFSQGFAFVVLEGADETSRFWTHVSDPAWRDDPTWPGLLRAPVIILPLAHKQTYLDRYAEADKARHGLQEESAWPVPFWLVDTAFATMLILLSVVDAGLGALYFGLPGGERALLADLGVPAGYEPIGAVAIGWPDGEDRPSPSLARGHRPTDEVLHRGRW